MATTTKEIGKIFFAAREKKELTREEAARLSRIHLNVVKDIENGVFDRLGRPYIKSFLKKYSAFLGIDTAGIMSQFDNISARIPSREFNVDNNVEKPIVVKDTPEVLLNEKKIQMILVATLSVVLLVLLFVLVSMMKTRFNTSKVRQGVSVSDITVSKKTSSVVKKNVASKNPVVKVIADPGSDASKGAPLVLTLKALDEVWLRIDQGAEKVFDGFLQKGESRTWNAKGTLTVWTGKADMLEFVINTRKVGVVARGVVKNIQVSASGVKIGDTWVDQL